MDETGDLALVENPVRSSNHIWPPTVLPTALNNSNVALLLARQCITAIISMWPSHISSTGGQYNKADSKNFLCARSLALLSALATANGVNSGREILCIDHAYSAVCNILTYYFWVFWQKSINFPHIADEVISVGWLVSLSAILQVRIYSWGFFVLYLNSIWPPKLLPVAVNNSNVASPPDRQSDGQTGGCETFSSNQDMLFQPIKSTNYRAPKVKPHWRTVVPFVSPVFAT